MPIISYIRPSREYATLQEAEQKLRLQADIAREQQLNKALTGAALGGFSDLMMKRDPNYQRMQQLKEKILSRMLGEEAAPSTSAAAPLVGDADGLFPRFDDVNPVLADILQKTYGNYTSEGEESYPVLNPGNIFRDGVPKPKKGTPTGALTRQARLDRALRSLDEFGIAPAVIKGGEVFSLRERDTGAKEGVDEEFDLDAAISRSLGVDPDEGRAEMLERLREQGVFE